jgi:hypothetical protein
MARSLMAVPPCHRRCFQSPACRHPPVCEPLSAPASAFASRAANGRQESLPRRQRTRRSSQRRSSAWPRCSDRRYFRKNCAWHFSFIYVFARSHPKSLQLLGIMLYLPRAFHLSMSAPNARRGGQNAKASPTRSLTALAEVSWESLTVRHVEPVTRANEPDPDGAKQASRKAGKHNEVSQRWRQAARRRRS